MLNFDARVKNSDAAQPRVTNVKTPNLNGRCETQRSLCRDAAHGATRVTAVRYGSVKRQSMSCMHQEGRGGEGLRVSMPVYKLLLFPVCPQKQLARSPRDTHASWGQTKPRAR